MMRQVSVAPRDELIAVVIERYGTAQRPEKTRIC